jgi:hypothetical protein
MAYELYRHFDKDGHLLYVGVSLHTVIRLRGHRAVSGWFDDIARIEIERFSSRREALKAERRAIKKEKPPHNRIGLVRITQVRSGVPLGAPRIENRNKTLKKRQPWKVSGMSRRTWFRLQRQRLLGGYGEQRSRRGRPRKFKIEEAQ